jgi:RHS repeat-associated protein
MPGFARPALLVDSHQPFPEPLIPLTESGEAENSDLQAAITAWERSGRPDSFGPLENFLAEHPQSPWSFSLTANMGILAARQAQFAKALHWLETAYELGKTQEESSLRRLADRALGELLRLYARFGDAEALERWLHEADERPMRGAATEGRTAARLALWGLRNQTGVAHRCGAAALKGVLLAKEKQPTLPLVKTLESARSGPEGLSLADLERLAGEVGLALQAVYRESASTAIPTPAVVHWKVGHYGALLDYQGGKYLLRDGALPQDCWIASEIVEKEGSGFFLVENIGAGLRNATEEEKQNTRGRGYVSGQQPGANKPSTPRPPIQKPQKCDAMATYTAYSATVSLVLEDTPLGYTPPKGPVIDLAMTYVQREDSQPANFSFFNFGPKWNSNWLGWVQDIPGEPGNSVSRAIPGGGTQYYNGYDASTGQFTPQTDDGAILQLVSETPIRYVLTKPDGSQETYAQSNGATAGTRHVLLSEIRDASGNTVTLSYDDKLRLTTITDAIGQKTTFTYGDPQDDLLVTAVTDPFGRSARLAYDDTGRLVSITDVIGIVSSFGYDSGDFIESLTTPYGKSTFRYGEDGTTLWLEMTNPLGETDYLKFTQNAPIEFSDPIAPTGMNLFNAYLMDRNSFYWDAHAYAHGGVDYSNANLYHFLHWEPNTSLSSDVIESQKDPLTRRVWYNYPGQVWGGATGTLNLPSIIGRVLEDGTTQLTQISYGQYGHITSFTDPVGRETLFTYAENGIDLIEVAQKTATGQDVLFQATYNDKHLPLTITDASGGKTTFTYNESGQVLSVTNALDQTTQYEYDNDGYLIEVRNANGVAAVRFSYDKFGRVASLADAEGYTLRFQYDALNRLTEVLYPDGTKRLYTYDKLDLVEQSNRLGQTTKYTYDAARRLIAVTDPSGRVTKYGYNEAGYLTTLTDPAGNVTTWERDIQNRVVAKVYANGTKETYTYDPATGQLATVTDAKGQVKTYGYTIDERISTVEYTNAQQETPNVSFTYGTDYPRIASRTDGIGTTTYQYVPAGTPGAGQVAMEITPNGTISFTYDLLGRKLSRSFGLLSESYSYDAIGRVISQSNPLATFNVEYLGQSDLPTAVLPDDAVLDTYYRYGAPEEDRRLRAITHNAPFPLKVLDFLYQSNPEDQVTLTIEIGGRIVPGWKTYEYDASGRLILENQLPGGLTAFHYDAADNILGIQGPRGEWTASYNNVNEIVQLQDVPYDYDANGNLTSDGVRTYEWDAENRLVRIGYVQDFEKSTTFQYDGLNRRAIMVESIGAESTTTTFLWDGTELLQAQKGEETVAYFPQGELHGNEKLFYVQDRLGSVRETVNENGRLTAQMEYTAYGVTETRLIGKGAKAPDYRYAGLFLHEQSGLYLAVFRAYDPTAGRWISQDRLGEGEGLNLYQYANSSPLNFIDTIGSFPLKLLSRFLLTILIPVIICFEETLNCKSGIATSRHSCQAKEAPLPYQLEENSKINLSNYSDNGDFCAVKRCKLDFSGCMSSIFAPDFFGPAKFIAKVTSYIHKLVDNA